MGERSGETTTFIGNQGARLSEALFRLANDPADSISHLIAEGEVSELRDLAVKDGELFIDTVEGINTYVRPTRPIIVLGTGQGTGLPTF